jgi:adenine-specific DNA methylase
MEALHHSGLQVVAVHPVKSELGSSTHIREVRAIEYDAIIVCRKRLEPPRPATWAELHTTIHREVTQMRCLLGGSTGPSREDLLVMLMSSFLVQTFASYPLITDGGETLSVPQLIERVDSLYISLLN